LTRYVLDTNAASALMRGEEPVVRRLTQVRPDSVAVPQPVLAEIAYGIERLAVSKRQGFLRRRFELLRAQFSIAPWTADVTDAFGRIKSQLERMGKRIEDFDAAIAAHASGKHDILVTADTSDMSRIPGLKLENWSRT
jgi:tRNA(fMet)-specific endonuclease VapC